MLFLVGIQIGLLAMEQPPAAAASKKRPAAAGESEEIEILKEAEDVAPVKQAREKKKIYTLKVPVSGTSIIIDEQIDSNEIQDSIAFASIAELIEQEKQKQLLLLFARVPTSSSGKNFVEYYKASNLHRALFGDEKGPQNPNAVGKYNLKTPNKAPIAGEIYYYMYLPEIDSFVYFGSDRELFTDRQVISKRLYENGMEFYKKGNYRTARSLFKSAALYNYDLGLVAEMYYWQNSLTRSKKDILPATQQKNLKTITQFITVIKDKSVSFLLEILNIQDTSIQYKLDAINKMLEAIAKSDSWEDLSNEQKSVIQQKLVELQKLKQLRH